MTGKELFQIIRVNKGLLKISAIERYCGISEYSLQKAVTRNSQDDFNESDKLLKLLNKIQNDESS